MARYSSHLLNTGDIPIVTTGTFLTPLDITREYDEGEVLVLITLTIRNDAAAARSPIAFAFDGQDNFGPTLRFTAIPAGGFQTRTFAFLRSITAGRHTFRVRADADLDNTQVVPNFNASLVIIQLPIWDSTADFIGA